MQLQPHQPRSCYDLMWGAKQRDKKELEQTHWAPDTLVELFVSLSGETGESGGQSEQLRDHQQGEMTLQDH